jgi:hypothetical protein
MSSSLPSNHKRDLLISALMVVWIVGIWGYMLAQSSREREFPSLAHQSLFEYFFITASLLIAPFIGGFRALRVLRSKGHVDFPGVIGWLLLVLFALVLFFSCIICWGDYHRYAKA